MKTLLLCALIAIGASAAQTAEAEARRKLAPSNAAQSAAPASVPRSGAPLVIVDATRPGQDGYVHVFLLDLPDGDTELQVAVELPDQRIVWFFLEVGVGVVPFMQSGEIEVSGRIYKVRHLYGIRPFPDDESMDTLRRKLWDRVVPWVENPTPYCNPLLPPQELCLSCLGFVLHVLFPGPTPKHPAVPRDFPRTASALFYTTDDLVLYLTGLHEIPDPFARFAHIQKLAVPEYLREELMQLLDATSYKDLPNPPQLDKLKNASDKSAPGPRKYSRTPPQRKRL